MKKQLTHINEQGAIHMVDISYKGKTLRIAEAQGKIKLSANTLDHINHHTIAKGNVLSTAKIAGIQAAKKTVELIPLCHHISLSSIDIDFTLEKETIIVTATVKAIDATGVEMEALSAVSVSLLTIYDMCKAIDKSMILENIHLIRKEKHDLPILH